MRVVIAPDSFKGSLSASQVAEIMARAVKNEIPSALVIQISTYTDRKKGRPLNYALSWMRRWPGTPI